MTLFGQPLDDRARFTLRHGLVPWGLIAGVVAAIVAVAGLHHVGSDAAVVVVAIVCFLMWATLVAWAVGALLWELRQRPVDASGRRPDRHTP